MNNEATVRTTRGKLWKEVLWNKSVGAVALFVAFTSTASFVWDEFVAPALPAHAERPKLIQFLRPWYAWSLLGLGLIVAFVVERAYQLISIAEKESAENAAKMYDGRPLFVLEVLRSGREWDFRLKNCGDRTARYVKLDTIPSRGEKERYFLHFQEIPAMPQRQRSPALLLDQRTIFDRHIPAIEVSERTFFRRGPDLVGHPCKVPRCERIGRRRRHCPTLL